MIGRVAGHGDLRVIHDGEVVGTVPAEHLADAPSTSATWSVPPYLDEVQEARPRGRSSRAGRLQRGAAKDARHPNLARGVRSSTSTITRSARIPWCLPGADAAVMRIKGTELGFAVTTDGRGRHCYLDPRGGGAATVAEAYRNLSCVGAEPVAVTDCLNFGSPEKPDGYYQLAECIEGMSEACEAFGTPVVSGNVSLYNETEPERHLPDARRWHGRRLGGR